MVSAFQVAKRLCELSQWTLSNQHLQLLLYMMQVLYYGENNGSLLKEKFEACKNGIVISSVYLDLKVFGDKPIEAYKFSSVPDIKEDRLVDFIDRNYDFLKVYKASELAESILKEKGA